jgi:hypothetical protein
MPGYIVHQGAEALCSHGGRATPTAPMQQVLVNGQPAATMAPPYAVSGCPVSQIPPCVTASWLVASQRVRIFGDPIVLFDSQAMTNNGAPLQIVVTQTRVTAQ